MYLATQTNQAVFIASISRNTPFAVVFRDTRFSKTVQHQFKNLSAAERRLSLHESRIVINKIGHQLELYKDDPTLLD